jgi:hypothetical protein
MASTLFPTQGQAFFYYGTDGEVVARENFKNCGVGDCGLARKLVLSEYLLCLPELEDNIKMQSQWVEECNKMKKQYDRANVPSLSVLDPTAVFGALEALHEAQVAGIRVSVDGADLVLEPAPTSPELLSHLDLHEAAIVALLHRKEDGRNALHWHEIYEDCVRINETEGGLSREEAEANALEYCWHTWLRLNPVMLSDGVCPHCNVGEESGPLLPYRGAWVHESCESAWSQARQAETAVDDLGAILDWAPPFSQDCCAQCGEKPGDALYYAETYGVHEGCEEALSQARQAEAMAVLSAMGLRKGSNAQSGGTL